MRTPINIGSSPAGIDGDTTTTGRTLHSRDGEARELDQLEADARLYERVAMGFVIAIFAVLIGGFYLLTLLVNFGSLFDLG